MVYPIKNSQREWQSMSNVDDLDTEKQELRSITFSIKGPKENENRRWDALLNSLQKKEALSIWQNLRKN